MFDHPLLRLEVGGRHAFLEPDLIAFQLHGKFHVVEIKSFAVIDGQADGAKVAAAAIQSAVYVLALRDALAEQDIAPEAVSHEAILVCPENFSNRPVAISIDVRKQLTVLRRQLARIARIDDLLDLLSPGLTFDLEPDGNGIPQRKTADVSSAIRLVEARYAPECLSTCEMCYFCRDEARAVPRRSAVTHARNSAASSMSEPLCGWPGRTRYPRRAAISPRRRLCCGPPRGCAPTSSRQQYEHVNLAGPRHSCRHCDSAANPHRPSPAYQPASAGFHPPGPSRRG